MANLNLGIGEQRQNILGNKGTETISGIKKTENKFGSNFGNKGAQQIFEGNKDDPPWGPSVKKKDNEHTNKKEKPEAIQKTVSAAERV